MAATVHGFQTEVTKLLNLLANSLYSNKEVFLRELISNASDAIDKLHFLSLTNPELTKDDPNFRIRVTADKDKRTLTIQDNGIGMTLDEANAHLGTIAKSGTEEFVRNLSGDQAKDSQLIGQFGVGFYSAFIVADQVTVLSRSAKAKPEEGVRWSSAGTGEFESENVLVPERGTTVILHLKEGESEFLDNWSLRQSITKYSDNISTPIELYEESFEEETKSEENKEGENAEAEKKEPKKVFKYVQINQAKPLWVRNSNEVKSEEYQDFYRHNFNDYRDALDWSHNKVEGELDYTSLLFIPSSAPMNLMMRDEMHSIKLYVQRVFIMDESDQFLPSYLRFVRGIIDTNALPLNVSRELLQESSVTRKLKTALTKRALNLIEKISRDEEKYKTFVAAFNDTLKEGISDDPKNQEKILSLIRFASTVEPEISLKVSLDSYISRMKDKQKNIYFLCSDDYQKALNSPVLERLKRKGIEVLLLWKQPIDTWIIQYLNEYKGHKFINANSADLQLGELEDEEDKKKQEEAVKENADLVERFKTALGSTVEDVRISTSLTDAPSCVVAGTTNLTPQMRLFARMQGTDLPEDRFILELNPNNQLVKSAYAEANEAVFKDWANLIYMQAVLADQGSLSNPTEFVTLVNKFLLKEPAAQATQEKADDASMQA